MSACILSSLTRIRVEQPVYTERSPCSFTTRATRDKGFFVPVSPSCVRVFANSNGYYYSVSQPCSSVSSAAFSRLTVTVASTAPAIPPAASEITGDILILPNDFFSLIFTFPLRIPLGAGASAVVVLVLVSIVNSEFGFWLNLRAHSQ